MNKFMSRLYAGLAYAPLLVLAVILALQTVFLLDSRALWFSDEIRYANVFEHVINAKKWLVMYLNGVPYPDKPPVYFWFLSALLPIFKGPVPALFMTGAAISALFLVSATTALSRWVFKAGREVSLGAGLILLSCFYFIGLAHYSRMDLLFAALITASHICLFKAFERERADGLAVAGFLLAAVAVLTKGPLGLIFPLLTSIVFLAWRKNLKRLWRRDVGLGLGLALLVLGIWVAAAWFGGEHELIRNIFHKQIYKRAVNASHHEQPFWHYFATMPLAWLPWTFMLAALPLSRLVKAEFWGEVCASRSEGNAGTVWLWIQVLSGFILLTSLSTKIIVYLLPTFPPLALLMARGFLNLTEERSARFMLWTAGLFAFAAVSLPFGNLIQPWPIEIEGLWWTALASALAAAALWFARRFSPRAALLTVALVVTAWMQPLFFITLPSVDGAMSPKAQGELMGEYIDKGYTPAAYKIYSGVYTYYCGHNILETQDLELIGRMAAEEPRMVLGMQRKYWEAWENRPESLRVVHEQWVVDRPYVLLVKDGPAPADAPAASEPAAETAPAQNDGAPALDATEHEAAPEAADIESAADDAEPAAEAQEHTTEDAPAEPPAHQ